MRAVDALLRATARAEARHFWFRGFRWFVTPLLRRATEGRPGARILDCGCGTGANLELLGRFGVPYGFDLSPVGLYIGTSVWPNPPRARKRDGGALPGRVLRPRHLLRRDLRARGRRRARGGRRNVPRCCAPAARSSINVAAMDILRGDHSVLSREVRRYSRASLARLLDDARLRRRAPHLHQRVALPADARRPRAAPAGAGCRANRTPQSEIAVPPAPVNALLSGLLWLESVWLRAFDEPAGSSLLCLARKPDRSDAPEDPQPEVTAIRAAPAALGRHEDLIGLERDRPPPGRRAIAAGIVMSIEKSLGQLVVEHDGGARAHDEARRLREVASAATPPRGAARRRCGPLPRYSSRPRSLSQRHRTPGRRVVLRLLPAAGVAEHDRPRGRRGVELLDGDARSGRRPRPTPSRSAAPDAAAPAADRSGAGTVRAARAMSTSGAAAPSSRTLTRAGGPAAARLRPPNTSVPPNTWRPSQPSIAAERRPAAVGVRHAGGFRRQRPAVADVPLGPVDAVPRHLVRAHAADQNRIRQRPAVVDRVGMRDEVDVRAERIGHEPHGRVAAAVPVLHELQPLALRAAPAAARPTAALASPIQSDRPPQVELLPAIHREHGRRGRGARGRRHVVQQAERGRAARANTRRPTCRRCARRTSPARSSRRSRRGARTRTRRGRRDTRRARRAAARSAWSRSPGTADRRSGTARRRPPRASARDARSGTSAPRRAPRTPARRRRPTRAPTARRTRSRAPADELARRRRRPEHADAGEILRALLGERAPVGRRAAGEDDQRHDPQERAGGIRAGGRRARRAQALVRRRRRAIASEEQRHRQPHDLRPDAGGEARRSAAATASAAGVDGGERQRLHGERRRPGRRCRSAAARPSPSRAGTRRRRSRPPSAQSRRRRIAIEAPEERRAPPARRGRPQTTPSRLSARASDGTARCTAFASAMKTG